MEFAVKERSKNLSADQRRQVTVQAVLGIAAEQDPGDITTAAIAERMQVTQGALFRHFPSKDALWGSVMDWVAGQLLARTERAGAGLESPLAGLRAIFMAHIEFVSEHPGVPRMLFGVLQKPAASPARQMAQRLLEKYTERLCVLFERAKACGEASPDLDARIAALMFIGSIQGLVMQSMMLGDHRHIRRSADEVFELYLRGVRT